LAPTVPLSPTEEELQASARLLVHLSRQPRLADTDPGLESLTQEGMARATGTTRGSAAHALGRLLAGQLVVAVKRHVPGRTRRVQVYQLTAEGEAIAHHISRQMVPSTQR
jgi:hypothetical protein